MFRLIAFYIIMNDNMEESTEQGIIKRVWVAVVSIVAIGVLAGITYYSQSTSMNNSDTARGNIDNQVITTVDQSGQTNRNTDYNKKDTLNELSAPVTDSGDQGSHSPTPTGKLVAAFRASFSYPSLYFLTVGVSDRYELFLYNDSPYSLKKVYSGAQNKVSYIQIADTDKVLIFDSGKKQLLRVILPDGAVEKVFDLSKYGGEWVFTEPVLSPKRNKIAFTVKEDRRYRAEGGEKLIAGSDAKSVLIILDINTWKVDKEVPIEKYAAKVNVWTLDDKIYLGTAAGMDCGWFPYAVMYDRSSGEILYAPDRYTPLLSSMMEYEVSPDGKYAVVTDIHPESDKFVLGGMCEVQPLGVITLKVADGTTREIEKLSAPEVIDFVWWLQDSRGFVYKKSIRKPTDDGRPTYSENPIVSSVFVVYDIETKEKKEYNTLSEIKNDGYSLFDAPSAFTQRIIEGVEDEYRDKGQIWKEWGPVERIGVNGFEKK